MKTKKGISGIVILMSFLVIVLIGITITSFSGVTGKIIGGPVVNDSSDNLDDTITTSTTTTTRNEPQDGDQTNESFGLSDPETTTTTTNGFTFSGGGSGGTNNDDSTTTTTLPQSGSEAKIGINTEREVFAFDVEVEFSETLNAIRVEEGDFLGKDGADTYSDENTASIESNSASLGATRIKTQSGVSGSGTLFNIYFEENTVTEQDLSIGGIDINKLVNGSLRAANITKEDLSINII